MILADVNALIHAFREDSALYPIYRPWLRSVIYGNAVFAVSPQVLSSVLRISTNRRIFAEPNSLEEVIAFAETLMSRSNCRIIQPATRHWAIFCELCRQTSATGDLIPDAWLAALAIEHDCELISEDRGFAVFPGLRWRSLRGDAVQ